MNAKYPNGIISPNFNQKLLDSFESLNNLKMDFVVERISCLCTVEKEQAT